MKTYTVGAYEFAMLFTALQEVNRFTHDFERTEAELEAFTKRFCCALPVHFPAVYASDALRDGQGASIKAQKPPNARSGPTLNDFDQINLSPILGTLIDIGEKITKISLRAWLLVYTTSRCLLIFLAP